MLTFEQADGYVTRLLEIYRFNVRKRLMPRVVTEFTRAWTSIEARQEEAKRDRVPDARFKRVRCIYLANAILSDSVVSSAFGYRMNYKTRRSLVQNPSLKVTPDGRNNQPQGIPFHVLVLERAESYLDMVRRAAHKDPSLMEMVQCATEQVSRALSAATAPVKDRYPRPYRENIEIVRWALINKKEKEQGEKSEDESQKDIEKALWNNRRVLVDITIEAALQLLHDNSKNDDAADEAAPSDSLPQSFTESLSPDGRAALLRYVERRVQEHLNACAKDPEKLPFPAAAEATDELKTSSGSERMDFRFADTMTFFWAIFTLAKEAGSSTTSSLESCLKTFWQQLDVGELVPLPRERSDREEALKRTTQKWRANREDRSLAQEVSDLEREIASYGKTASALSTAFENRAWFPATSDLPEIAEETKRSECLALYNLCELESLAKKNNLLSEAGRRIVDSLIEFLMIHIVGAACDHSKRNTDDEGTQCRDTEVEHWLPGAAIAPSSLHVLSMYIWALGGYVSYRDRKKADSSPATVRTACRIDVERDIAAYRLTLRDAVCHASEINIADHRLFGDYLCWNGHGNSSGAPGPNAERVKAELQGAVRAYFASDARRPLNILVCADPGSGKSFFVKNVLKDLKETEDLQLLEENATQFRSPHDLFSKLRKVTSQIASSGKGLFFLDEVDTSFGGDYLFSQLIAPMWDGEYPIDGETLSMKKTVWFFAASAAKTPPDFEKWMETENIPKREDFLNRLALRIELPIWTQEAALLTFLGNLRRIHKGKVNRVSRDVLDLFATKEIPGRARAIEKCVLMLGHTNGCSRLEHVPGTYREMAMKGDSFLEAKDARAREYVSIVDF